MRKLMLTLGLFAALGVCAQETIKTTANKFNGYGIVYSLPRTALDIEVTVTRSVEKAGPFAKYAQKYLGTAPIANTDRLENRRHQSKPYRESRSRQTVCHSTER